MRILLTLENPERTGAPKMAVQYAAALVAAGHGVIAACGPPSKTTSSVLPQLVDAGVEVRSVPPLGLGTLPTLVRRLRALIRDEEVACVVGFQQRDRVLACLLSRLTGARCVISAQNQHVFRGGPVERWVKERVYRGALAGAADLAICASGAVEEEVRARFGLEPARTRVVPNGIDVHGFPTFSQEEIRETRAEFGVSDEDRLVLSVGRLDPQKGQDLLLDAFRRLVARHPDARLGVVGTTGRSSATREAREYHRRIRSLAASEALEGRVRFLGWRDDVPRLLAATDLYAQPSRWEGWPVAVVEAMAAGVPLVTSDCSGRPRGFVDGEHGWIVPTGDVEALEAALSRALRRTRTELRRMGGRARVLAERYYDIRDLQRQFVALVEEVGER